MSVLDLAPIAPGSSPAESIKASVALAQQAERHGYRRVWYAEHHSMATIASSAPSVLIAHVAAHTDTIRLGAGGVMLPNHVPLVIAEQYGTLETMHPGRIDLGLGRAPGSDPRTMRALRRDHASADSFPDDVRELQAFLSESSPIPGVQAVPGAGTDVPLYILGSSMHSAHLAAALGLPYVFASHFAPQLLTRASDTYRREFQPSAQLEHPYVIAGVNVVAAESGEAARDIVQHNRRTLARGLVEKEQGASLSDRELDAVIERGAVRQFDAMFTYTAVGEAAEVAAYLTWFQGLSGADELITAHQAPELDQRLASLELAAEWGSSRS
jgi:luciferase family oxidoreductase group 1